MEDLKEIILKTEYSNKFDEIRKKPRRAVIFQIRESFKKFRSRVCGCDWIA